MTLEKFNPPGYLEDLDQKGLETWHSYISKTFDEAREGDSEGQCEFYGPRENFVNPAKIDIDDDAKYVDITWTAFPRNISVQYPDDQERWGIADSSREYQDEYCEWSVIRDKNNKISQVTFTCETPEYWILLSQLDPNKLLELYVNNINPNVEYDDIFQNEKYNPYNKWNNSTTNGAMHLIQRNNTLGAEIELAGGSSIRRIINGKELTGERELIECGKYGGKERHSDPHIGAQANSVVRQDAYITLADPVGIYFSDLNTLSWETPDGTDPQLFWKYTRGSSDKYVRAVLEVPQSYGYTIGDILINGDNINFGSQIADCITMKLTAIGFSFGKVHVPPMTECVSCKTQTLEIKSLIESIDKSMVRLGKSR